MPLRNRFAASGRHERGDFLEAAALITAVQFTRDLGNEMPKKVGHRDKATANDPRSDFGGAAAISIFLGSCKDGATYVHRATGKR